MIRERTIQAHSDIFGSCVNMEELILEQRNHIEILRGMSALSGCKESCQLLLQIEEVLLAGLQKRQEGLLRTETQLRQRLGEWEFTKTKEDCG